jgi:hypothetical protein
MPYKYLNPVRSKVSLAVKSLPESDTLSVVGWKLVGAHVSAHRTVVDVCLAVPNVHVTEAIRIGAPPVDMPYNVISAVSLADAVA